MIWLLCIASTVPFLFAPIPPLVDLPGHLGRYSVELDAGRSAILARNWGFSWGLAPNLGFDLLVPLLAPICGLEGATRLLAAALPPILIWGLARVGIAVNGRVPALLPLAAPFAIGLPLQFGFLNFCLGWGCALHLFASWVLAPQRTKGRVWQSLAFGGAALAVWLCHLYGWAILVVLAVSFEAARLIETDSIGRMEAPCKAVLRLVPLALPLLPMALAHNSGSVPLAVSFFDVQTKSEDFLLSPGTPVIALNRLLVGLAISPLFLHRQFQFSRPLTVALLAFAACEILLPRHLMGSALADTRLWPVLLSLVAVTATPLRTNSVRPHRLSPITALALVTFLIQTALLSQTFARAAARYREDLAALDQVPSGSAIAVLTPLGCGTDFPVAGSSRLSHLGDLAISRRQAFVNSEWSIPGAQFLHPRRATGTGFSADPSQFVLMKKGCDQNYERTFAQAIGRIPQNQFDFVWILDADTKKLPVTSHSHPVFRNEHSVLMTYATARQVRASLSP